MPGGQRADALVIIGHAGEHRHALSRLAKHQQPFVRLRQVELLDGLLHRLAFFQPLTQFGQLALELRVAHGLSDFFQANLQRDAGFEHPGQLPVHKG